MAVGVWGQNGDTFFEQRGHCLPTHLCLENLPEDILAWIKSSELLIWQCKCMGLLPLQLATISSGSLTKCTWDKQGESSYLKQVKGMFIVSSIFLIQIGGKLYRFESLPSHACNSDNTSSMLKLHSLSSTVGKKGNLLAELFPWLKGKSS